MPFFFPTWGRRREEPHLLEHPSVLLTSGREEAHRFPYSERGEAYPEGLEVCLKALIKGRHVEASLVSGAGPRTFAESTKERGRPGEMSDKLLRWSLEKVFASSPTPRKRVVHVCQRWKCELFQEWESERICDQVLVASQS